MVVDLTCQRISGSPSALGEVLGEQRLAGARLAAHEQRPLERDGDVHRVAELVGGDVAGGALELIERVGRDDGHRASLPQFEETVRAD